MIIKLNEIVSTPGGSVPFDYTTDFSDVEIDFVNPFKNPMRIVGEVVNRAGVLTLDADCETVIDFDCMRCAEPTTREWSLSVSLTLTEKLQNPEDIENADIVVIENAEVDADLVIREWIILESDMVLLCSEDCGGVFPHNVVD